MITYKTLNIRNPEFDADYWQQIRALCDGGKAVVRDRKMLSQLLPQMPGEEADGYRTRLDTAYYASRLGRLIDDFVSAMAQDPVAVAAQPADAYYADLVADTSAGHGHHRDLNTLLREQLRTALMCGRAWTLVDFPVSETKPTTLADQERMGLDQAYLCEIAPEAVLDWECDESGALLFALVLHRSAKRRALADDRSMVTETYTEYTRTGWTRYSYTFKADKQPVDEAAPDAIEEGTHSFGIVPLIPLELPPGLWAGNHAHSIAVEILRKESALSVQMGKGIGQFLVAKLAPAADAPGDPIAEDTNRDVNQKLGPDRVWRGVKGDELSYLGPSPEPLKLAMEYNKALVDTMHGVLSQMAKSVPNTGASIGRSAESKTVDKEDFVTVLKALGEFARNHARSIFEAVAKGRQDTEAFKVTGAADFDATALDTLVAVAKDLDTVRLPSPTFRAAYLYELARRLLPNMSPERLALILAELEAGFSSESEPSYLK